MSTIKNFEGIEAWKESRKLVKSIYQITREGDFSRDYGLKDQIQRAAVSVMSNIAEGFERSGNKEFINFLSIAKGSCGEVRSQLYLALDLEYITETEFNNIKRACVKTSVMIQGLITSLKKSDYKGPKYK